MVARVLTMDFLVFFWQIREEDTVGGGGFQGIKSFEEVSRHLDNFLPDLGEFHSLLKEGRTSICLFTCPVKSMALHKSGSSVVWSFM